jgi:hypothetical protein
MKKLLVLVALILAIAAVLWRLYPELIWPLVEQTPLKAPLSTSKPIYQWRDAQGVLQVTDEPPPAGTPYEVKQYSLDANILRPSGTATKED